MARESGPFLSLRLASDSRCILATSSEDAFKVLHLLLDDMHQTDPWTIEDGINDTCIKPFKDFILNSIPYLRV